MNNQLEAVIDASGDKKISITTGLGVSHSRLSTLLKKIKNRKIRFNVSGETTGKFFELIRYGTTWGDFKERVRMIEDNGHEIGFISTMSNISILDFSNFYETYHKRHKIMINTMSERPFLMPHVLDDLSKENFILETRSLNNVPQFQEISRLVNLDPSETDRSNVGNYLKQFSSRRSMDTSFLPEHFRKWCGL